MVAAEKTSVRGPRGILGPDKKQALAYSVQDKRALLFKGEVTTAHADRWMKDVEFLRDAAAKLEEVCQHIYKGTVPQDASVPDDVDELKLIVAKQAAELEKLKRQNTPTIVKNGGYVTKSGRVFTSKPGRKTS